MQYADRIGRLHAWGREKQIDLFLISSPAALPYYTGYFFYFEHGPSPFQLLPGLLVTGHSIGSTLLLADNETPPNDPGLSLMTYESYRYIEPLDFTNSFPAQLMKIIGGHPIRKVRIGIEKNHLPLRIAEAVSSLFETVEWVDISEFISVARSVKDSDEIALLRRAANLCDTAQRTMLAKLTAGQTELELFSIIRHQLEEETGTRVPVMADLVSGARTAAAGGIPSSKRLVAGDLVLGDFTPCLRGYWGDCCNTVSVGPASLAQQKDFQRIKDGLSRAIEQIRPGLKAKALDQFLREHISDYPHHSGHGVGTMSHEEPRITPYNETELQAGMVIALEPAIYRDDYGMRLEHLILVTADGAEVLTRFDHQLQQA